jgi:TonB family protein
MQSRTNTASVEPVGVPIRGLSLLIEPEPWLRAFLRNLGDLFRPDPPKVWITAAPGEYWADALVHRPVPWSRMLQSYLGHAVVLACVYAGSVWWLNQPHVIREDPEQTSTVLRYPLSEYLPEIRPKASRDDVPVREHAQKADPELSPQKIVSLNVDHTSTRQTIIQPDLKLLQHDVPLPNLVAWTRVPIAPVAARRPALDLPAPEVAAPAQPAVERNVSRLTFPVPPQPQVVAPSSPVAANLQAQQMLAAAMAGPIVIRPAEDAARHDPNRLQLPAQAPPQVAGPPSVAIARSNFAVLTPVQPEVVPAPQSATQRGLAAIGMPGQGQEQRPAVTAPSQPIAGGVGRAQMEEAGRLLALNAHPLPPNGAVSVPEGNRKGEFAAGPDGHAGASGAPETKAGSPLSSDHSGAGSGPAGVPVDAPPTKPAGKAAAVGPRLPPAITLNAGTGSASANVPAADSIDNQIFGSRRRYSMHLSMPNVNSAMGSWTVRFAELDANPAEPSDLNAPEAIRKVDPAYPANLMREQIEGVVVLHAIIRRDGSVGDVRILEGFYEQLDENARVALEQWRFRPGTKNGVPVDVEAVIRVPFRVTKFGF